MSNQLDPGKSCQIVVADLFAMINARRKLFSMDPVEQRAMASRCTLRFNLERKRGVDFGNEKIAVAPQDMLALESMVNDQFGVNFEGELTTLCAKSKKPSTPTPRMVTPQTPVEQPKPEPVKKAGLGSKIKRLFGGN